MFERVCMRLIIALCVPLIFVAAVVGVVARALSAGFIHGYKLGN